MINVYLILKHLQKKLQQLITVYVCIMGNNMNITTLFQLMIYVLTASVMKVKYSVLLKNVLNQTRDAQSLKHLKIAVVHLNIGVVSFLKQIFYFIVKNKN